MNRDLWDWRRRIADLYADIRRTPAPEVAWQMWRQARDEMFMSHPQTPLENATAFTGLAFFDYDPALRFHVTLAPHQGPTLRLPGGADGDVQAEPFAETVGLRAALGGELTLYGIAGYGGGVFLPFTDATSGRETYGGGRYLLDTIKSADLGQTADGRTILDFNFAYAPSCAYSPRYVCPLAPAANRLPAGVAGGEKQAVLL